MSELSLYARAARVRRFFTDAMPDGRGGNDASPAVVLDPSRAPLYLAFYRGGDREEDLAAFLQSMSPATEEPFALVVVTSPRIPFVTPRFAWMCVQWLKAHEDKVRKNQAGLALVLRSALARGAWKALAAMAPLPFPWEQFKAEEPAIAWATECLQARGVRVPCEP